MMQRFIGGAVFAVAIMFATAMSMVLWTTVTEDVEIEALWLLVWVAALGGGLNLLMGLGGSDEE